MHQMVYDENGEPFYELETVEGPANPFRSASDTALIAVEQVARIGDVIADTSRRIFESLNSGLADMAPDEVELEFGVVATAEAGVPMLTKASGEATFKVRVVWRPKPTSPPTVGNP